jgi:Zn-dependent protease with chaperone function
MGELSYFLVFLFIVAVIGPGIIQKFWRCRSLESGIDRRRIEAVCRKAGLRFADILFWPLFGGRMITAAVMGLVEKFRYILVTEALLKLLNPEEVEAVIAHEIGHVKKKHLLFYIFFFAGYMMIAYVIFDLIVLAVIYFDPVHRLTGGPGFQQTGVATALFSLVIIVMFLIYFRFIFGYFMRNFERQADTYVYAVLENAQPLISTLEKIAFTSGQPPEKPNWHHFSIRERIDYLRRCESDRSWIGRHDRKIRKSLAIYIAAILFTSGVGYQLSFGDAGNRIGSHFFERVILRELEKHPNSSELHGNLGDLHYSRGNIREAIEAYERSLSLAPESPKVLNNLAWLYATSEDRALRDPARALDLARRAAAHAPAPHVLDTLAESYFVNGMYEEAIAAGTRALSLAGPDRAYYEGQLKRFREGLNEKG